MPEWGGEVGEVVETGEGRDLVRAERLRWPTVGLRAKRRLRVVRVERRPRARVMMQSPK